MLYENETIHKQYYAVDLVKFLCSIMVVMIHIAPFGINEKYAILNYVLQNCLTRVSVPFFFVASGFFLYKKNAYENFNIRDSQKYILKMIRLYIIWTIIYLPLRIDVIFYNKKGVFHGLLWYIRSFLFEGSYKHLWYLNATIVSVLLISFLLYKKYKIKMIVAIALILYGIGLFAQSWYGIIKPLKVYGNSLWEILLLVQKIIVTTRNGVFEGFLFVSIGMAFAFLKFQISMIKAIFIGVISYVLMFFEFIFVTRFQLIRAFDMYIFLVPATFSFFYIAKNVEIKSNKICNTMRPLSSLVYFLHLWVNVVVCKIFSLINIDVSVTCLNFVITLAVTIICALAIINLSNYRHFKWLKKLYS